MPRQIDLSPQNLTVGNNPNTQLGMSAGQLQNMQNQLPALIAKATQTAITDLLREIDAVTGLDLVGLQALLNGMNAALQQSWLNFQQLINSVVGGIDKDVLDLINALNSTGGDAATAIANWDTLFLDLGFSVTTASQLATWLGGTNTTAVNGSAWATRLTNDLLITSDVFHLVYNVGLSTDTPTTLGVGGVGAGKRTWYSAWNDLLLLCGVVNSVTAPTDPAPAIGTAITTAQSTATTANTTAGTALTNAGTANTNATTAQTWATRLTNDLLITSDVFHLIYNVGTTSDTPTTLGVGGVGAGKRTWYSAWNDLLALTGVVNSVTPPTDPAPTVGTAVTTAQSTATTANTAAGTAQTTANTANTMFGLGQQAGTNLVLAPGFENAAAWTSASSGTQSTAQAHSGTNSWMLQGAGSGNTTTLRLINNSAGPTTLKSRVGEVFQLQSFIYPKTGNTGGGTVKLQIVCTDSTGINSPTTLVAASETVPATGSWSALSGTASVPSGYDTVDPQLILLSVPTTDFVYVDDVLVRETTLVTTAQSTASAASANANSALSQLSSIPAQTVVPNLMAGASSVTFDNAGSGGSATNPSGSVSTPLTCTGTQTIGASANIMVAAATYSLVGSGSVSGSVQIALGSQQMQSIGTVQLPAVTEFIEYFILWSPPAGTGQTVTATGWAYNGGVSSVSFETASYRGVTNVSTLITNSGTGTSLSLSVPAAVAGTMAVNAFSAGDVITKATTALSGYTKTSRGNITVQVNSTQYGYQSLVLGDSVGGSGGVTFGATGANSSAEWVGVGVVLSATSVLGSGLRQYRTSTLTAAPSSGNQVLGAGNYDTTQYLTSDLSISAGVATVTVAGHYMVTISQLEAAVTTVHQARVLLYQNGSVVQQGQTMYVTTTASNTWVMQSSFTVYCSAGDTIQPGVWYSAASGLALTGEATGTCTYWEVALVNRSLL